MRRRALSRPVPIKTGSTETLTVGESKSDISLPVITPLTPLTPKTERELRRSCSALLAPPRTKSRPPEPVPNPINIKIEKETYRYVPKNAAKSFTTISDPAATNSTVSMKTPQGHPSTHNSQYTKETDSISKSQGASKSHTPKAPVTPPKTPSYAFAKTAMARKMSIGDIQIPTSAPPPFRKMSLPDLNPAMANFPADIETIGVATTQPVKPVSFMTKPTLVNHRPTSTLSPTRPKTAGAEINAHRIPDQLSLFPRPRTTHGESKTIFNSTLNSPSEPGSARTFKSELAARPLPPLPPELKAWPPSAKTIPRTEESKTNSKTAKSKHGFSFWKFRWGRNHKKRAQPEFSTW